MIEHLEKRKELADKLFHKLKESDSMRAMEFCDYKYYYFSKIMELENVLI